MNVFYARNKVLKKRTSPLRSFYTCLSSWKWFTFVAHWCHVKIQSQHGGVKIDMPMIRLWPVKVVVTDATMCGHGGVMELAALANDAAIIQRIPHCWLDVCKHTVMQSWDSLFGKWELPKRNSRGVTKDFLFYNVKATLCKCKKGL